MPNKRYNKQVPGFKDGGSIKKKMTKKKQKLAAMYGDKKKITRGDIITAAKKNKGMA
jgi:hypothetical protein